MTIHERQEIAEAILNELHFRRYNEAIVNGCNEKEAMTLADNWELYKDAQSIFKFYVDLANVVGQSEQVVCPECKSTDFKTAIHTDYKECNKCYHYWEAN